MKSGYFLQGSVRRCVACLTQGSPCVVQGSMELEILLSRPPKMCQPFLTLTDLGSKMLYFGFEHIIFFQNTSEKLKVFFVLKYYSLSFHVCIQKKRYFLLN